MIAELRIGEFENELDNFIVIKKCESGLFNLSVNADPTSNVSAGTLYNLDKEELLNYLRNVTRFVESN